MKRGFTLAEILISVGIIGVVAALMLPMVNKYKPDEYKIRFLQSHTTLMQIVSVIIKNREAYPLIGVKEIKATDYNEYPLMNLDQTITIDGVSYSGNAKLCRLLAMGFNTTGTISCSNDYNADAVNNFVKNFKTVNGVEYMIQTYLSNNTYETEVYIDVDGSGNGPNCFIVNKGCQQPDRFILTIGPDGQVKVGDSMSREHLNTRTNWKLNRDKAVVGNKYSNKETVNLPTFKYVPDGLSIPDPQPVPSKLRKTRRKGVYCTKQSPYIHYFWSQDYNVWVELDGVSHVDADDGATYGLYNGQDSNLIGEEPNSSAW